MDELLCGAGPHPKPPIAMAALFTGAPPPLDDLRDRVVERWGGLPLLRRTLLRPARPTWLRPHRWVPLDGFDVRAHVREHVLDTDEGAGGRAFTDLLGRLVTQPVPDGLPPWRLRLVRTARQTGAQEWFGLVLTAHHALMDGRSLELLLSGLLDGGHPRGAKATGRARAVRAPQVIPGPRRAAPAERPRSTGRPLDALRTGQALPLPSGPPGAKRDLAWVDVDTDAVRAARRALPGLGASLNEILLAASAGALRTVHGEPDHWAAATRPLYGLFAVDLRTPEQPNTLGNVVSAVRIPLPMAIDDPRERLAACRAVAAAPDSAHTAAAATHLLSTAARLGPWGLRLLAVRANSRRWAPVVCTAIRWPRGPWSLDGAPLAKAITLPQVQNPEAVSLTLTSYAGTHTLSVISNTPPGQARLLAAAFERELTSVGSTVSTAGRNSPL
ncbi:WS/DGAT domain-containing protein [Streptomyces sp. NRRL S-920]|uniref:WS/DGAT domain-containing protein n=1 Tax=Streptomyces sp. NRRL S-920 TaxID=1463921 RepID=UPI00131BB269|nr:WS/DGAT domain-containing protein [Streptomyces sp. NRRL S-920]